MILLGDIMKMVVDAWRDPQRVAIAQQDTTIALANQRTIPVSTVPGQIFSVHQWRNAIGLIVVEDNRVDPKMLVRNHGIMDDMLTGTIS